MLLCFGDKNYARKVKIMRELILIVAYVILNIYNTKSKRRKIDERYRLYYIFNKKHTKKGVGKNKNSLPRKVNRYQQRNAKHYQ